MAGPDQIGAGMQSAPCRKQNKTKNVRGIDMSPSWQRHPSPPRARRTEGQA